MKQILLIEFEEQVCCQVSNCDKWQMKTEIVAFLVRLFPSNVIGNSSFLFITTSELEFSTS